MASHTEGNELSNGSTSQGQVKKRIIDRKVLAEKNPDPLDYLLYFSHHGEGAKVTVDAYDDPEVVKKYTSFSGVVGYGAPRYAADMAVAVTSGAANRSKVKVIDVGAGSGAIGKSLYAVGFRDVTAHDGAQAMVDACRNTGAYSDFLVSLIDGPNTMKAEDDTYDVAIAAACIVPDHVPLNGMEEIARVVKPGGYVLLVARLYTHAELGQGEFGQIYEEHAQHVEEKGVWKKYGRFQFPHYNSSASGKVDIFQVL